MFTDGDWWQAKAKAKPDKAGFVHLRYLDGLLEEDVALSADSPRIRAAQAPEEADCPEEAERAKAGAEVVLWSEYAAALDGGGAPATGGVLAQLKRNLAGRLAALEAFVAPEGVDAAFPAHSSLVDELARHKDGTGLLFLSAEGAPLLTQLQAQRLTLTKVLQGWERCFADPAFDSSAVREPRRVETGPASHKKSSKKPPPPELPFDSARTSPALNNYLLRVVQNWSLLHRRQAKTGNGGALLSQLEDLISFLHPWELPHLTVHHVAHAVAAWQVHYGELGLGVLSACPPTCEGGVKCLQFVALDSAVTQLRQAELLWVAQGWLEGGGSSNFEVSEVGVDALWERCAGVVEGKFMVACTLGELFPSWYEQRKLGEAFEKGWVWRASFGVAGPRCGVPWGVPHETPFATEMAAYHAGLLVRVYGPPPEIEMHQFHQVAAVQEILLVHGCREFPRENSLVSEALRVQLCSMLSAPSYRARRIFERWATGRARETAYLFDHPRKRVVGSDDSV